MIISLLLPLLAQASVTPPADVLPPAEPVPIRSQPRTLEEDRLTVCLKQVRENTTLAIDTAQKKVEARN